MSTLTLLATLREEFPQLERRHIHYWVDRGAIVPSRDMTGHLIFGTDAIAAARELAAKKFRNRSAGPYGESGVTIY